MRRLKVGNIVVTSDAPNWEKVLAYAVESKSRPLCLCRTDGVPMYVARYEDQFIIKRMPSTGLTHSPDCESYEAPHDLSGLGPLWGDAIRVDGATGACVLRLDFSLSKTGQKTAPQACEPSASRTVKAQRQKLTLRALLHYLWHEGDLTSWKPAWSGKRGWARVRSNLLDAARRMSFRNGELADSLLVPEVFSLDRKAEIAARRAKILAKLQPNGTSRRALMILIGEVKEFAEARTGRRLVVKHMPDYTLYLDEKMWKSVQTKFSSEIEVWSADDGVHLAFILTFGLNASGYSVVEEISLMLTNSNWIPIESAGEMELCRELEQAGHRFMKGLRFDLTMNKPVASAILPDIKPKPLAMFIVSSEYTIEQKKDMESMMLKRPDMDVWIWNQADGPMPALPQGSCPTAD